MNRSIRHTFLTATAACGLWLAPATAQTTATTDPVGAMTVTIPNNSDSALGFPLLGEVVFEGKISTVDGVSAVTLAGNPNFQINEFSSTPHYLEIQSGSDSGMLLTVLANSASSLNVQVSGAKSLNNVVPGTSVVIRKALVISDLIALPPDGLSVLLFDPDSSGVNKSASGILFSQGGNWINALTFATANDYIIHPFESIVVRNESGLQFDFSFYGSVPTTGMWTNLYVSSTGQKQDVRVSVRSPVDIKINQSGISDFAKAGDTLLFFDNSKTEVNKSASGVIFYDGSSWIDAVTFLPVGDTATINAGEGFILRLEERPAVGNIVWKMSQPY